GAAPGSSHRWSRSPYICPSRCSLLGEPLLGLRHEAARHEIAVLIDMRRDVDHVARRTADLSERDKPANHQDQRPDDKPGNPGHRPRGRIEHALARRQQEESIDGKREQEQHKFDKDRADHGVVMASYMYPRTASGEGTQ